MMADIRILKNLTAGQTENTLTDIQSYLSPVLDECNEELTTNYTVYGLFCAKFLHAAASRNEKQIVDKSIVDSIILCCQGYSSVRKKGCLVLKDPDSLMKIIYNILPKLPHQLSLESTLTLLQYLKEEIKLIGDSTVCVNTIISKTVSMLLHIAVTHEKKCNLQTYIDAFSLRHHAVAFLFYKADSFKEIEDLYIKSLSHVEEISLAFKGSVSSSPLLTVSSLCDDMIQLCSCSAQTSKVVNYMLDIRIHQAKFLVLKGFYEEVTNILNLENKFWTDNSVSDYSCIWNLLTCTVKLIQSLDVTQTSNSEGLPLKYRTFVEDIKSQISDKALLSTFKVKRFYQIFLILYTAVKQRFASSFSSKSGCVSFVFNCFDIFQILLQHKVQGMSPDQHKKELNKDLAVLMDTHLIRLQWVSKSVECDAAFAVWKNSIQQMVQQYADCISLMFPFMETKTKMQELSQCGHMALNLGKQLYKREESCLMIEMYKIVCHQFTELTALDPVKQVEKAKEKKLADIHEWLAEHQRRRGLFLDAMETITKCIFADSSQLDSTLRVWTKIKTDLKKSAEDVKLLSRTISSVAEDLQINTGNGELIDKISLLQLELEALKKSSKNLSESKYAVLSEMLDIPALSQSERADVLVDMAELVWLNSSIQTERKPPHCLEEAAQLLQCHDDITALVVLGKVKLWMYIIDQETFCRKIKEKIGTTNDLKDEETDDVNFDENEKQSKQNFQMNEFNISKEVSRTSVLDSAVDCWHKAMICGKASEVVNKWSWLQAVRLCSQIYQLINQHIQALKVHGMAVLLARMVCNKEDYENSILRIVDTLITLGYTNPASKILSSIEKNIIQREGNQLDLSKLYLRRAKLLFCEKNIGAAMELLDKIVQYTSERNVKDKNCCLLEGSSKRLMSVCSTMSENVCSSQPTDQYAFNLANGAVRLHTGVRLYVSGKEKLIDFVEKWLVTHESLESLLNLGQISMYIGAAREAKCYLKEGLKLAREMGLVNWSAQFMIELTKICTASGDNNDALQHLSGVQNMFSPTTAKSHLSKTQVRDPNESSICFDTGEKINNFKESVFNLSAFCHHSQCHCASCKDFFLQNLLLQHQVNLTLSQSDIYHAQDFSSIFDGIHNHFRSIAKGEFTRKYIIEFMEMIEKYPVLNMFDVLKETGKQYESYEYFNPVFLRGFFDLMFVKLDSMVLIKQFENALNLAHCGLTLLNNKDIKFGNHMFFYKAKFQWYVVQITMHKSLFHKLQTKEDTVVEKNNDSEVDTQNSSKVADDVSELKNEFEKLNISSKKCVQLPMDQSESQINKKLKVGNVKNTSNRRKTKKPASKEKLEGLLEKNSAVPVKMGAIDVDKETEIKNCHSAKASHVSDQTVRIGGHENDQQPIKPTSKEPSLSCRERSKKNHSDAFSKPIIENTQEELNIIPGTPPDKYGKKSRIPRLLQNHKVCDDRNTKKNKEKVKDDERQCDSPPHSERAQRKCKVKSSLKSHVENNKTKSRTAKSKVVVKNDKSDPYRFDFCDEKTNKKTSGVKNIEKTKRTYVRKSSRNAKTIEDRPDCVEILRTREATPDKIFSVSPVKINDDGCHALRGTKICSTKSDIEICHGGEESVDHKMKITPLKFHENESANIQRKRTSNVVIKPNKDRNVTGKKKTNSASQKRQASNIIEDNTFSANGLKCEEENCKEISTHYLSTEIFRSAKTTSSAFSNLHRSAGDATEERNKKDNLENDLLTGRDLDMLVLLEQSFNLVKNFPPVPLYSSICKQLALHSLDLSPLKCAYYLSESAALTFRHYCIYNLSKRIRKMNKEGKQCKEMVNDLSTLSKINQKIQDLSFNKEEHHIKDITDTLPENWTVCQVTMVDDLPGSSTLLLSRFEKATEPQVLKLPAFDTPEGRSILTEFSSVLEASANSMKIKEKVTWWTLRGELNERLQTLTENMEKYWLGYCKGWFLGKSKNNESEKQRIDDIQQKIHQILSRKLEREKIQVFLHALKFLSSDEIRKVVLALTGLENSSSEVSTICAFLKREQLKLIPDDGSNRHPVILILDKSVQHLPWESLQILRNQTVTRIPSLYFLSAHLKALIADSTSIYNKGVNSKNTFYILNPDGNLSGSQDTFQDRFTKQNGWAGIVGRPPSRDEYLTALSDHDLLIYCGHGSGSKYLDGDSIQQANCRAVTILMGCSSGTLQVKGQLDPTGIVLNYLIAGCCCVIGNLWDVTDRDIDKFLDVLLHNWLDKKTKSYLTDNIAEARDSCKLPYLIGAAPVVYGLPVFLSQ